MTIMALVVLEITMISDHPAMIHDNDDDHDDDMMTIMAIMTMVTMMTKVTMMISMKTITMAITMMTMMTDDNDDDDDVDAEKHLKKRSADNACLCWAVNASNNCFGNCHGCHAFFK